MQGIGAGGEIVVEGGGLGYPAEFIRMWEFYFCYCEGGFAERVIGDVQMLLVKPLARPQPIVPPLGSVRP